MKRVTRVFRTPAGFLLTAIVIAPLLVWAIVLGANSLFGSAPAPIETATAEPTGADESDKIPELIPGGTAELNKPYFDYVNKQTIALLKTPVGQNFIDGLVGGGFDRAAMQLTPDKTAADLQADSIQFSVQVADSCLIGQWGEGSRGYQSLVAPVVPGIGCLIGETRPIDW